MSIKTKTPKINKKYLEAFKEGYIEALKDIQCYSYQLFELKFGKLNKAK